MTNLCDELRRHWEAWGSPKDDSECFGSEQTMAIACKQAAEEIERLQVRINGYADTNVKLRSQLAALGVNPFKEMESNIERQQAGGSLEPCEPLKLREDWVLEAETPAEPNDQGIVAWRRYRRVQTLEQDTLKSSPADLVDALQDQVHTDTGPVRAARAVKSRFWECECEAPDNFHHELTESCADCGKNRPTLKSGE